ncbi:lysozyme [Erythrobacter alti]|uniref:lysozyme n=1 Tax=Erythrobacter alti TaxID=1896145 RepID=UPI0030F48447
MRAAMVRELISRMRSKEHANDQPSTPRPRARRRKKKAALAVSAMVMTVGSTGYELGNPSDANAITLVSQHDNIRRHASKRTVSEELKEAIAEEEGVHLTVYADPIGKPTVGVGHLVRAFDNLSVGDVISYERALEFLEQDLKQAEAAVARLTANLPLYQHEYDALVDLVFNIGEGNANKENSPNLNAAIKAGDYAAIAEELAYHTAGNAKLRGLAYRSDRRAAIFQQADYSDPRPRALALRDPQLEGIDTG